MSLVIGHITALDVDGSASDVDGRACDVEFTAGVDFDGTRCLAYVDDAAALAFEADRLGGLELEVTVVHLHVQVLFEDLHGGALPCAQDEVALHFGAEILCLCRKMDILLGRELDVSGGLQLDVFALGHQPLVVFDVDFVVVAGLYCVGFTRLQQHGLLRFHFHLALLRGETHQVLLGHGIEGEDVLSVPGKELDALFALAVIHQQFILAPGAQDILGGIVSVDRTGSLGGVQGTVDHRAVDIAVDAGQGHFGAGMQGEVEAVLVAGVGLHHAHRMARLTLGGIAKIEGKTHPVATLVVNIGIVATDGLHFAGEVGGHGGLGRDAPQRMAIRHTGADEQQFVAVVVARGITGAGVTRRLIGVVFHLHDKVVTVEALVGMVGERETITGRQTDAVALSDESLALPVVGLLTNQGDAVALFPGLEILAIAIVAAPAGTAAAVGAGGLQFICWCAVVVFFEFYRIGLQSAEGFEVEDALFVSMFTGLHLKAQRTGAGQCGCIVHTVGNHQLGPLIALHEIVEKAPVSKLSTEKVVVALLELGHEVPLGIAEGLFEFKVALGQTGTSEHLRDDLDNVLFQEDTALMV